MLRIAVGDLSFHIVELAEELQRLLADLALMVGPQLMELVPGMRHAAHLGHAKLEAGLVAAEVVGDKLALPARLVLRSRQPEEAAHVLSAAAVGEVEDDGLERVGERRRLRSLTRARGGNSARIGWTRVSTNRLG